EILTYNAIAKFEPLDKNLRLYECYNHLGLIYLDLNDYDKALEANQKALGYLKKIKQKGVLYEKTLNNIGLVYEQKGEYEKAVNNFKKALENKHLKSDDSYTYALLIDNLAYNQFKSGDTTHVRQQFNSALKIRDSLNNTSGIIRSKLHMAE
ncbi:MAG: tetratricopeptide repeat protein, partial [Zetaproteobacteria bacterium]|nr:tetratricopeptide repeat protein [Zetaproteobacteria bacterium]